MKNNERVDSGNKVFADRIREYGRMYEENRVAAKREAVFQIFLKCIVIIFLAAAIYSTQSHYYYVFIRCLLFGSCAYFSWHYDVRKRPKPMILFGFIGMLFNPVLLFIPTKGLWIALDIIAICTFSWSIYERGKKYEVKDPDPHKIKDQIKQPATHDLNAKAILKSVVLHRKLKPTPPIKPPEKRSAN